MKKAYIIRHGKAQRPGGRVPDKERPLTEKGRQDASKMAKFLKNKIEEVNRLYTSPARRAYETASAFAFIFDQGEENLRIHRRLYEPDVQDILEVIRETSNPIDKVLMFTHNPACTRLANLFADEEVRNVPTCGIIELTYKEKSWYDFGMGNTFMTGFWYPKMFD